MSINSLIKNIYNYCYYCANDIYSELRKYVEYNVCNLSDNTDINEVYPNIYVSNFSTTTNIELLTKLNIKHILTVMSIDTPNLIDNMVYYKLKLYDTNDEDILKYFEYSKNIINGVLDKNEKILIHCQVGRSRSITIALSFILYKLLTTHGPNYFNNKKNITNPIILSYCEIFDTIPYSMLNDITMNIFIKELINNIKKYRNIAQPNVGFINQLKIYGLECLKNEK